jgi:START domain-containing protein
MLIGQESCEWKLVKNPCGINVYIQKQPNTQIRRVKVVAIAEASLSQIVSIIKDANNHKEWVFLNKEAYFVEEISDFKWKYYGHTDSPWPVSDRDFITDVFLKQDTVDYTITISSKSDPEFLPEKNGCVRIPFIDSKWTLRPINSDSVKIVFELAADIGGKVPIWLVNLAVTKGPLLTMNGLLKELDRDEHQSRILSYINDQ